MTIGAHVFGEGRVGLWIADSSNLTDKLTHYLPRLRGPVPNLTDLFLPPAATSAHRNQCRAAGFFVHTYIVAHDRTPVAFAKAALAARSAQKTGALELNFEGGAITDLPTSTKLGLKKYVQLTVAEIRRTNPNLPLRINVVPYKGEYLPVDLINHDDELYACAQGYGGNMDLLYAADEVEENLNGWGIVRDKTNVMHAVMCSRGGGERHLTLPTIRSKGALYIDDLLLDAGLL